MSRDVSASVRPVHENRGRRLVVVVGIDVYQSWPRLHNAVSDARAALKLFLQLGFESSVEPLLDRFATAEAMRRLVVDDLASLGPEDSLVIFFAGHGGARESFLDDGHVVRTGYIIPVDAANEPNQVSTWIELGGWLDNIARLPAKHILVILDACHSGIALAPRFKWREGQRGEHSPNSALRARRSRRVITSALENQLASDVGPVLGHSLFTGCIIEALTGGLRHLGQTEATGSELGVYVQRRVREYSNSVQTPDFGRFELDNGGEMVIPVLAREADGGPNIETTSLTRDAARRWRGPLRLHLSRLLVLAAVGVGALVSASYLSLSSSAKSTGHLPASLEPDRNSSSTVEAHASSDMVAFPKQEFLMGSSAVEILKEVAACQALGCPSSLFERERPLRMIRLSPFTIDRNEVTNVQFAAFVGTLDAEIEDDTIRLRDGQGVLVDLNASELFVSDAVVTPRAGAERHPVQGVSHLAASMFCSSQQKRLPSEAEWEFAARGTTRRQFPWGDVPAELLDCNAVIAGRYRNLRCASAPWGPAPVGAATRDSTPEGIHDLGGNVSEWVADKFSGSYPDCGECVDPVEYCAGGNECVVRGGNHVLEASVARSAARSRAPAELAARNVGFRCAK